MNSMAALYALLIPVIGAFPVLKRNEIRRKALPISGLELTYRSAGWGILFFGLSYIIVKVATFAFGFHFTAQTQTFFTHLFSEIDTGPVYLSLAMAISYVFGKFAVSPDSTWYGDSTLGSTWIDLAQRKANVILFLDSDKCYVGRLDEVEISERVRAEDRLVTLYVFLSGARLEDGTVDWNTTYPIPIKTHFHMSHIISFSEYVVGATFKIQDRQHQKPN